MIALRVLLFLAGLALYRDRPDKGYSLVDCISMQTTRLPGLTAALTNIHDETTPLFSIVKARALAMDQATLEYEMRLDPFSYRPTFKMALRMLGLDVKKTNDLALAYGHFDFEHGNDGIRGRDFAAGQLVNLGKVGQFVQHELHVGKWGVVCAHRCVPGSGFRRTARSAPTIRR